MTSSYGASRPIAYLEIPSLQLQKEIVYGMTSSNLDKNLVTMNTNQKNFDEKSGHFILAGHANVHVFGSLSRIQINDSIFIVTEENRYEYVVIKKEIVSKDYLFSIQNFSYRHLTLITCTKDSKNRWIISAKEK